MRAQYSSPSGLRAPLFLAAVAVLAAGCQYSGSLDPDSPRYLPPPGSVFHLDRPLPVPAGLAGAEIQSGAVGHGEFAPHCILRLREPVARDTTLAPGDFEITRTVQRTTILPVRWEPGTRIQVAGPAFTLAMGGGGDAGPTDEYYVTEMSLHNPERPEVHRLDCRQLDDPGLGSHVTFREIQATLRPIAWIVPAGTHRP